MSCGVGRRRSSDPVLLWCRPAATAPIGPLAWEPPYAAGVVLKRKKYIYIMMGKSSRQIFTGQKENDIVSFGTGNYPNV